MRTAIVLLALLATALTAAACGSSDDQADGSSEPAPTATTGVRASDLAGRTFASTAVEGRELVAGSKVILSFEAVRDVLGVRPGCNQISGPYAVEDGLLRLTSDPIGTLIGCEQALQEQDRWMTDLLLAGATATLAGDRLTLERDGISIAFAEQARRDDERPPLEGTTWMLERIEQRSGAASSLPAGVEPPTLQLTREGRAQVFTGCNRGQGPVDVRRDEALIVFGPLALTEMGCDDAAARVERAVTAILDGMTAYSFDGPLLSIAKRGDRLVFRAG